jgi:hypothetical protein
LTPAQGVKTAVVEIGHAQNLCISADPAAATARVRAVTRKTTLLALLLAAFAAAPAAAAPDPLGDADGDGIPYQSEVPAPVAARRPAASRAVRCRRGRVLRRGRCVRRPRCRRGRTLRRGRCVRRRARARGRRRRARAAAVAPPTVAQFGADPNHKDVFVQVDYANAGLRAAVACAELDALVAAFAAAPVSNPDGTTGIRLHIDAGRVCPTRSYDLGGSRVFDAGACPDSNATFQRLNLPEHRIGTFHIAGFSPTCGQGGAAGVGDLHGTRSMVFTDGPSFAHVLMHELGHNFGLDHPFPGQPNRVSTMNSNLSRSPDGSSGTTAQVLDYQRIELPALDEGNLSETAGISAPPSVHELFVTHRCPDGRYRYAWPGDGAIDWNCNSPAILLPWESPTIDPAPQAVDLDGDGQLTVLPATHEEWSTLDYASGGGIGPR